MLKVLNVNSLLDTKIGGGAAERTFQMSRFLAKESTQCVVLTLNIDLNEKKISALSPATVEVLNCLWERFYIPKIRWKLIRKLVNDADIIHLMGHWSVLNAFVYFAIRLSNKPYVVCPAGALPLFGRSRFLKQFFNLVVGKAIIRNASAWIAVTAGEFPHFESYGIPASQVTVIPNGVSKEDFPIVDIKTFRLTKGLSDNPIILFMGRLNPIKGPDLLLRAFALVQSHIPDYQLVFSGPDEGMQSTLINMAKQEGVAERVHFLGFVGGNEKSAAYHMASLLVVPSRQEAMSIVALEAGICGIPVLLTDQCGFSEIKTIDPGLEVPASAEGIATGLINLLNKPSSLKGIASSFEKLVSQRYTWSFIVERYLYLYKGLLEVSGVKTN